MSVEGTMAAVGVQEVTLFLIVAILTGVLTKYFIRIQYIAALVIVGAILGLTPIFGGIEVRADIIYYVFLPLILFEGGLAIHIRHFRETVDIMLILAFPGLIAAMILVGYCVHILFGLPLLVGMLLGAIVMPTDPVSVIATFKKLGAPPRLTTIIEGESVLNDGAGIVAFGVVMGLMAAGEVNIPHAAIDFVRVSAGGAIVGILMGYVGTRVLQYVDDHIFEVTITIIIAFATFLLAGVAVDDARVKATVAALQGVNIDEAIEKAAVAAPVATAAPAGGAPEAKEEKKEEKKKDEGKSKEEAAAGLGALFG